MGAAHCVLLGGLQALACFNLCCSRTASSCTPKLPGASNPLSFNAACCSTGPACQASLPRLSFLPYFSGSSSQSKNNTWTCFVLAVPNLCRQGTAPPLRFQLKPPGRKAVSLKPSPLKSRHCLCLLPALQKAPSSNCCPQSCFHPKYFRPKGEPLVRSVTLQSKVCECVYVGDRYVYAFVHRMYMCA